MIDNHISRFGLRLLASAFAVGFLSLTWAAPARAGDPLQCKGSSPGSVISCCQKQTRLTKPVWMSSANLSCSGVVSCGGSIKLKDRCIVTIPGIQNGSHESARPKQAPSDIRLKTAVHRVGTTVLGLPLYSFQYRGQPGTYVGVMAQDVLKVEPQAVSVGSDGFYRVNYAMLGIDLVKVQ